MDINELINFSSAEVLWDYCLQANIAAPEADIALPFGIPGMSSSSVDFCAYSLSYSGMALSFSGSNTMTESHHEAACTGFLSKKRTSTSGEDYGDAHDDSF